MSYTIIYRKLPKESGRDNSIVEVINKAEYKKLYGDHEYSQFFLRSMENYQYCKADVFRECMVVTFVIPDKCDLTDDKDDVPFLQDYEKKMTALEESLIDEQDMLFSDRVDRLADDTKNLRELALQILEMYQTQIDAKQNKVMQFLTVVTTVFTPFSGISRKRNGFKIKG